MNIKKEPRPIDPAILSFVETTSDAERTTHQAQCHCGAVKFSVILKWPFPQYPINKCTCSICMHNGYFLVYPARRDVVFTEGTILHPLDTLSYHLMDVALSEFEHTFRTWNIRNTCLERVLGRQNDTPNSQMERNSTRESALSQPSTTNTHRP